MKKITKTKSTITALSDTRDTGELPNRAKVQIRVIFHGLLVSAFKTKFDKSGLDSFEVGALSPSPVNHTPKLIIFNVRTKRKELELELDKKDVVRLQLTSPSMPLLQRFISADPAQKLKNYDLFLDYEAIYKNKYPRIEKLTKITENITPKFILQNGVVQSLIRTPIINAKSPFNLSRAITQVIGVDIFIQATIPTPVPMGFVAVSNKLFYPLLAGEKYNVIFENDCGDDCDTKSGYLDLNYLKETFSPPAKSALLEFELYDSNLDNLKRHLNDEILRCKDGDPTALMGSIYNISEQRELLVARLNPCGMGYFGTSNGLEDN